MIRIVLHPLAPGDRVLLGAGWHWWRAQVRPDENGNWFTQTVDDPEEIREASVTFAGPDARIVDPPAMHLTTINSEYENIYSARGFERTMLTSGSHTHCDVVWHGRPGEGWEPLPGNTCVPGDYVIEQTDRAARDRWDDSTRLHFDLDERVLTFRDGGLAYLSYDEARRFSRDEIAQVYGVPSHLIAPVVRGDATGYVVLGSGGGGAGEATASGSGGGGTWAEPPLTVRTWLPGDENLDRVGFVMLHTGDPGDDGAANQASSRLRVEFGPDGVCRSDVITWQVGPGTFAAFSVWDGALTAVDGADHFVASSLLASSVTMAAAGMISLTDLRLPPEVAALLPTLSGGEVPDWRRRWHPLGVLTPNEIRRREGLRALPPRSPNYLNPEDRVLDDIDRLVNEQVREGPVNDYNIYPKCKDCGHDFHGLDCAQCGCINTDWLKAEPVRRLLFP